MDIPSGSPSGESGNLQDQQGAIALLSADVAVTAATPV